MPKSDAYPDIPFDTIVPLTAVIRQIQPKELWEQVTTGSTSPVLIDIREEEEFARGHIPKAQLIPMPRILSGGVHLSRNQNIVLVCRTGRRTTQVAHFLQEQGYENLTNMQGGMVAWQADGLPQVIE